MGLAVGFPSPEKITGDDDRTSNNNIQSFFLEIKEHRITSDFMDFRNRTRCDRASEHNRTEVAVKL
jgi:hypothetical protein